DRNVTGVQTCALPISDLAVFGRKDAQQLAIIERLVADLDLPVRIEKVDIQREPSGLARSSRNVYLSATGRDRALALRHTLDEVRSEERRVGKERTASQ